MSKAGLGYVVVEHVIGEAKSWVFDEMFDTIGEAEAFIEDSEEVNEANKVDGDLKVEYKIFKLEATKTN